MNTKVVECSGMGSFGFFLNNDQTKTFLDLLPLGCNGLSAAKSYFQGKKDVGIKLCIQEDERFFNDEVNGIELARKSMGITYVGEHVQTYTIEGNDEYTFMFLAQGGKLASLASNVRWMRMICMQMLTPVSTYMRDQISALKGSKSNDLIARYTRMCIERIVAPLYTQLRLCHHNGMCHRDIKPDNIMIDADGKATFIDFGLLRRTTDKAIRGGGTRGFMSPAYLEKYYPSMVLQSVFYRTDDFFKMRSYHSFHTMRKPKPDGEALFKHNDMYALGISISQMCSIILPAIPAMQAMRAPTGAQDMVSRSILRIASVLGVKRIEAIRISRLITYTPPVDFRQEHDSIVYWTHQQGGKGVTKKRVLGRSRVVFKKKGTSKEYIRYHGEDMLISDARKLEKKIDRSPPQFRQKSTR